MLNLFKKQQTESNLTRALKNIPLFSQLQNKDFLFLEELLHERSFEKGEIIFDQDDEGLGMYLILSGKVKIVHSDNNGESKTLAFLTSGEYFGELALLVQSKRTATAIAEERSILMGFFRPEFLDILETHRRIGSKISFALAKHSAELLRRTLQGRETRTSL